jgi:hypothetical protein
MIPLSALLFGPGRPPTSVEVFIASAISKALATVFTYPLQIAQIKYLHHIELLPV